MTRTGYIYLANVFLGFHYYFIIYINSSFLSQFLSNQILNVLYIAGACFSIVFLLLLPRLLEVIRAKILLLCIISLEFVSVLGLALSKSAVSVAFLFISYQALAILILYCLDLFLESSLKNEKNTGWVRAIHLTMLNFSLIVSFVVVSKVASSSFSYLYILSAIALIPLAAIVIFGFERDIHKNKIVKLKEVISFISKDMDISRVLIINFLLQFFYAAMIIYLPFLLIKAGNFGWENIGKILLIMILPFVIFEAPLGKIFDRKTGEREFLIVGIIIMAISTFVLAFLNGNSFWIWSTVLFVTRIGASFVEIGSESYFFKKVTDRHSGIISFFRITSPLSFIALPLLAIPALHATDYSGFFGLLAFIVLFGGLFFIPKRDTK